MVSKILISIKIVKVTLRITNKKYVVVSAIQFPRKWLFWPMVFKEAIRQLGSYALNIVTEIYKMLQNNLVGKTG